MPMTRIDLPAGRPPDYVEAVADAVQRALHDALGVPLDERFQIVAEHGPGGLVVDAGYLGVRRSPEAILIQVTLNHGRNKAEKRHFFAALADVLHDRVGLRREDVVVSLVEVSRDCWSFGDGEAQLA